MFQRVIHSAVLIITYRNINHLQDTLQNYKSGLGGKSGKNLVTNVWPLRITMMLLTAEAMCVCLWPELKLSPIISAKLVSERMPVYPWVNSILSLDLCVPPCLSSIYMAMKWKCLVLSWETNKITSTSYFSSILNMKWNLPHLNFAFSRFIPV